jgi:hypothetical protein
MTGDQKVYRLAYWVASGIIAILLLSGYHKMIYPADFSLAVFRFHLLPDSWVNLTALYVSWLEVIVSICLLALPRYRVSALWISLVLLLLFTGAMSINLLRESSFGCGCFSSSPLAKPMSWMGLVRNGCLIALTALGLVSFRKSH